MSEQTYERMQVIFLGARSLSGTERDAFLDAECGDDAKLRSEVEALLGSDAPTEDGFLESPALGNRPGDDARGTRGMMTRDEMPERIGPYHLLQEIGEGGFGVVFMAEQSEPIRRRVALKIIKLGMDTKQVIARFEAERQALAMMDHPNIARVLDAGATETGRPYFVMELVKGVPITEYCDKAKLGLRERLALFMDVCHAVQHAHQKGIIHRDIKPSNVMITLHDGRPVPKVIDFGIAKATSQRLTEHTLFTQYGQFIGTPEYMSPEQAEMSGLDVDTRSDIYSLGVLLYELLTGTTPFDGKTLREKAFAEIQRIIREQEPEKPSTRVSTLGGASGVGISESNAQRLRMLRGDLDWIILRAMEKDRSRRYETANGLAADIERYLGDEPVAAGPPSAGYRVRKFVKRNRGGVVAGVLVIGALVGGLAGTGYGLVRAREAQSAAELDRAAAVAQAEELEAVLGAVDRMLLSIEPEEGGANIRVLELLDSQAARMGELEEAFPGAAARMYLTLAKGYSAIDQFEKAWRHASLAGTLLCGPEGGGDVRACFLARVSALFYFRREAVWKMEQGDYERGRPELLQAQGMLDELVEEVESNPQLHRYLPHMYFQLGFTSLERSDLAGAIEAYRRAAALADADGFEEVSEEELDVLAVRRGVRIESASRIAQALYSMGDWEGAVLENKRVLSMTRDAFGSRSIGIAAQLRYMSNAFSRGQQHELAIGSLYGAILVGRQVLRENDEHFAKCYSLAGQALDSLGRTEEGLWIHAAVLERNLRVHTLDNMHVRNSVERVHRGLGRTDLAPRFEQVVEAWEAGDVELVGSEIRRLVHEEFGPDGVDVILRGVFEQIDRTQIMPAAWWDEALEG